MNKIFSVILILFLSNIFTFIAYVPLFVENRGNVLCMNAAEQYKIFVNMPENFINICIEVTNDLKTFNSWANKEQTFKSDNGVFFSASKFAAISSNVKNNDCFLSKKVIVKNYSKNMNGINFSLIILLFIFYLIKYIGMLRIFSDKFIKQFMPFLLCPGN